MGQEIQGASGGEQGGGRNRGQLSGGQREGGDKTKGQGNGFLMAPNGVAYLILQI